MQQARVAQAELMAAGFKGAAAGRQHIAHPVGFGTVGQRDEQSAAATKDVDGGAILASAATAAVDDNTEVGQETRERPEDAIGSVAVEAGDGAAVAA